MRLLYVHATLVPPPILQQADRFCLLSDQLEGDVLQPVWFSKPEEVEAMFGPGSYPVHTVGRFRYHWFLAFRYQGVRQRLAIFWFYLRKGLELHKERRHEVIMAYSHMTTGLMAGILKALTGAKLIIELVTSPERIYLTDRPHPTWADRASHAYSDACLYISIWMANRIHLLFPKQLEAYPRLSETKVSVFHEFIPISLIERKSLPDDGETYVLLVGAPWYLKGADLLITAFRRLAPDFPQVRLKILGIYGEVEQLQALTEGCEQIELMKARPNPEALQIIRKAAVMVLPSRCEGLPRVLIEGMAAGLPLIGSDVAGIPFLIREGENGFVVPKGDPTGLEMRLRELLSDPELRQRMGEQSYQRACHELSEKVYVKQFVRMLHDVIQEQD